MRIRKQAFHDTAVMQKNSVNAEELADFKVGQKVMTIDGIAGRIAAVNFGPYQGTEDYEVVLDNKMGGGTYTVSQLKPMPANTASIVSASEVYASIPFEAVTDHTANIDYPELGDILTKRLPNENIKVYAANSNVKDDTDNDETDAPSPPTTNQADETIDPDSDDEEATEEPEDDLTKSSVPNVTPPSACSFCGNTEFEDPQMTGRGTRIRCAQCKGTMKSWGGEWSKDQDTQTGPQKAQSQWEPEFPNSSQNNASEQGDDRSGGVGGVASLPDANFKTSNLHAEAGIINWVVDKIYDRLHQKMLNDQGKDWAAPSHDNLFAGPAVYEPEIAENVVPQSLHPNGLTIHSNLDEDGELGFHFTARWVDVQAKARKIRAEGGVKIVAATNMYVNGEVKGDHNVYETQLNYVPGTKKVADWACGCKWGAFSFGRSPAYARFDGRLCSHSLALQYEANSRGMFGRNVKRDTQLPSWQKPDHPVVVQWDKVQDRNLDRRVVPTIHQTFSSLILDSDGIYPEPQQLDLNRPPIYAFALNMFDHGEPITSVVQMFASFGVDREDARSMVHEAWLEGPEVQSETLSAEGRWNPSSAGSDGSESSLEPYTADYSSADPLVGVGDQSYYAPTPHSFSENPASTGWATTQDPQGWGDSLVTNNFGMTFAGTLHIADQFGHTHEDNEPWICPGCGNRNPEYENICERCSHCGECGAEVGDADHQHKSRVMAKKNDEPPTASGVALKAADTGRILMIQRSNNDESDPARGTWEAPGGKHEPGDKTSLHGGIREWEEETGQPFPHGGHVTHIHRSGPYLLHTVVIPNENQVDFSHGRSETNPDDPDGDDHEQAAWWDPTHAEKNPALRKELKGSSFWGDIKKAAAMAAPCETPGAQYSTTVSGDTAGINVKLPFELPVASKTDAEHLEAHMHNAMEDILAPYFVNKESTLLLEPKKVVVPKIKGHQETCRDCGGTEFNGTSGNCITCGDRSAYGNYPKENRPSLTEDHRDWHIDDAPGGFRSQNSLEPTLDEVLAVYTTLNEDPEGALPYTDGSENEDVSSIMAGNTVDGPHDGTADSIRQAFLQSKGAQAIAGGNKELLAKIASKDFSLAERQELINEGIGKKARNFDRMDISSTHYAELPDEEDDWY